jgi:hypothetical protein
MALRISSREDSEAAFNLSPSRGRASRSWGPPVGRAKGSFRKLPEASMTSLPR